MRILLTIRLPHDAFNAAVKDGSVGRKTEAILDAIKPEAAYFTEMNGRRTIVMVAELEKPSMVPALAEPWFLTFGANVYFDVVMSPEDLKEAGLEERWARGGDRIMTTDRPSLFSLRCCGRAATRRAFLPYLLACIVLSLPGLAHAGQPIKPAPIVLGALYELTGPVGNWCSPLPRRSTGSVRDRPALGGVLGRADPPNTRRRREPTRVLAKETTILLERNPSTTALMGSPTQTGARRAQAAAVKGRLFLTSGATSPRLPAPCSGNRNTA